MNTFQDALMETSPMLAETDVAEQSLSEYELERGKPMPSKIHSIIQTNIATLLNYGYKSRFRVLSELSVRLYGTKYVPDIALYNKDASDWHEEELEMTTPPLLAIEIVSPSQSIDEMKEKADKYLAAGVKSVWLVLPALAGVMVLQSGRKARFFSEGELVDDMLEIRLPIDDVFE
jgi:Uma2 family endonuclease